MNNFISSIIFNYSNKLPRQSRFTNCLAILILLCIGAPSNAQVSMLGSVVQVTQTNTIASFTVPAGNNRILFVTASDAFATNITGVSFGATSLIEQAERNDGVAVDAFYTISLGSSAVPTSASIVMTSSNTSTNVAKTITARVFQNVDQTTNLNGILTNQNITVPSVSSLTVVSNPGDLVIDIFDTYRTSAGGSAQVAGSGQTITSSTGAVNFGTGGDFGFYSTSTKPGASSVSMGWSTTDHQALLHIAANIKQASCTNPTVPTITQGTTSSTCSATTTTLSIGAGSLNSASNWQWYSGSCGGVSVGSGTSITPSSSSATTYYVRGEGGCVTPGTCASITVPVNLPEIDVQGNSLSIADGSTTVSSANNTDFGNVIVGQTLSKTFTINNTGTSSLTVSGITSGNAKFTIGSLTPSNVIPGGSSASFTVLFTPTTGIIENSTITINNNDCDEGVYDFAVKGTGQAAITSLSLNGNATSPLGSATTFTATLQRVSAPAGPLAGQSVTFSITRPDGSIQSNTATTNSAGQASILFTSTMAGVHSVQASFNNAAAGYTASTSVSLTHTVIAQEINLQGNGQNILTGDVTPSLTDHTDFGNVFVGNNIVRTFTIQNTGGASLTVSNIVSNNSNFAVGTFPASIAAGNSTTFTVTFASTVTGTQNATLTIFNNDIDEGAYSFALTGVAFSHTSIYVDSSATGNNSGTSWADAFTDFQSALSIASANDAVYVAKGTYKPSVGAGYSRTRTFSLVNAVNFYGGFPSGGGTFASRDFINQRSVLSGDIGVLNDSTDNCFNVVDANNLTASTKMSGFTIERGVADSNSSFVKYGRSGGMNLGPTGAIRLDSVTFRNNFGKNGSAIYAESPVNWILNGCSFTNNTNASAIYIGGTASGSLTNCSFSNNQGFNGGAIIQNVLSATFTFTNCTFDNNKATASGGGGAINAGAAANTFVNCSFTNNTATNGPGGALYKFYGNLNSFTNCTFTGNSGGGGFGGGALISLQGGFQLNACIFKQNFSIGTSASTAHGGAIYNNGGTTTLNNCLFYGNYTQFGIGGAVYNNTGGTVNATSCTFALNSDPAYNQGGGLNNNSNSNASIMNCIFWNNSTNGNATNSVSQIGHGSGVLNVSNTIWKGNTSGGTIYNVDPLFVDATNGDFTLQDCSPAIDTGVTNSLSADILGNPRVDVFLGGLIYDLGAYERQTTPAISEIDVQSNSQSIADGSNTVSTLNNTDYGNVVVGQTLSKTFTIYNNGTSPLTVTSISSSNTKFTIGTLTPASPIAAGASSTFTVLFTPTVGGIENSTITINNNDCNEAVYDFALKATAICISPTFDVCPSNQTVYTLTNSCDNTVSYIATAIGTPTPAITYTFTGATTGNGSGTGSGSVFNKGTTVVTMTASNVCGSNATCSFNIVVADTTRPGIVCAAPVTINTSTGLCTGVTTLTPPTITDNCPGTNGNALNFDGTNDKVVVTGSGLNLSNSNFTVEFWAKRGGINSNDMIFSQGDQIANNHVLHIGFTAANTFAFNFYNNDLNATGVADLLWHHWACTFDHATKVQTIYRDGIQVAQRTSSSSFIGGSNTNLIIGDAWYGNNQYNGNVDELRVWTTIRTQSQIQQNLANELTGTESGLAAYYKFNQGIADGNNTTITSVVATTGVNGTFNNFGLNGTSSNFVAGVSYPIRINNAPATFPIGTTSVLWTAYDGSGNMNTCTQDVTVVAPEINVNGNNTSIVDGDLTPDLSDHTDFGNVTLGQILTRTFTIKNNGTAALTLASGAITITGTNAGLFSLGSVTLPVSLAPADSLNFTITFNASSLGIKNATVNISNDDCDEAAYDFAIKANADCSPVTITCPVNQTVTSAQNVCNAVVNYNSSSTGIPSPAFTYKFTGATTGTGSGDGSGSVFNIGVTHVTLYASNSCSLDSCTFDVTILSGTTGGSSQASCDSFQWANGTTYTLSGQYIHTFTNVQGCDSVHTLNLTIHNSYHFTNTVSNLGCYTWQVNNQTYTLSGTYVASFTSQYGCDSTYTLNLTITPGVKVAIKAILDGPYNAVTGLMNDSLRVNNLIPTTEPYTDLPYSKPAIGGPSGETVSSAILNVSGNNAIVDWVYLELRNAISPANIVASKRALLQRDGDIVSNVDGTSAVLFETVYSGNYFVTVKHRNHLGIMSANAMNLQGCSTTSIDFTSSSPVYAMPSITTSPRKLNGTVYTLWSGDAANNKNVKYNGLANDKDKILTAVGVGTPNSTVNAVYRMEDVNLDGKIRYNNTENDRLPVINNIGVNNPNNILNQHTPN